MLDVQKNKSLKPYNTFSIAVDANYFAEILSEQDLKDVLKSELIKQQNLLVLGGGSNVLFTKDFNGLVVKISIPGISSIEEGDDIVVTAGAGVVWNDLVK